MSSSNRVRILGCEFDPWTTTETVDRIDEMIIADRRGYLCTVNVSILMMMRDNSELKRIIEEAPMVVADGQPIIWMSEYLNDKLPERITGVDLVYLLASLAERRGWGVYMLGAKRNVVQTAADNLISSYPKLQISGLDDGYFSDRDASTVADNIRESGARILIIAMGVPKQEVFMSHHWDTLGVNFAIGVGGSFDVVAGISRRAPNWMQRAGLEWLFRMLQEPRRLFGRYLKTNSRFIYLALKEVAFNFKKNRG